jgi:23S rRNA pseudouridine2605 synthase
MAEERLQKFLAAAGVTSRRRAEELIVAGRVVVNGKTIRELGTKIDPETDLVSVDGKPVLRNEGRAYYLLYKPPGCVTTASDPQGRPTALEYLRGVRERVFAVGRLDYDAEGALLFTDDGELANRLAHPRYGHARTYLAKIRGEPHEIALARLVSGVRLEDGPAKALEAVVHERTEKNTWIRIVVGEGRFHLIKRLCEAVGLQIQRLYRPEFGGVTVEGLRAGEFRALTAVEVKAMKAMVGLAGAPRDVPKPPVQFPRAARRHGHGPPPSDPDAPPRERPERPELPEDAPARDPGRGKGAREEPARDPRKGKRRPGEPARDPRKGTRPGADRARGRGKGPGGARRGPKG